MSIDSLCPAPTVVARLPHLQAVLFDLDGTLLNTAPDLIAACQAALHAHHLPLGDESAIRGQLTSGMRAMLSAALGQKAHAQGMAQMIEGPLRDSFAAYYQSHICVHTAPFVGIDKLLTFLDDAKIKTGVITNKYYRMAKPLLAHFPCTEHLSLLLGGDSCTHAKPHPEPLLTACARLQVDPAYTLYVGDHLNDIKAAKAAGCISCCALWGYGALECGDPLKWQSDLYVKDAHELYQLIATYLAL